MAHKGSSHINTTKLKKQIQVRCKTPKVSELFMKQNSRGKEKKRGKKKREQEQVTATEATLSLHIIKLHFPYRSTDCTSKLNKVISSDSETATVNNNNNNIY